jgi:hypothetical protein
MGKGVFAETAPAGIVKVMPPSAEVMVPPAAPITLVVAMPAGVPLGRGVPFESSAVGSRFGRRFLTGANKKSGCQQRHIFMQQVLGAQVWSCANVFQRHIAVIEF